MRGVIVAIGLLFGSGCAGGEPTAPVLTAGVERDDFVISGDACGASRVAHLVGQDFTAARQGSLMLANANVVDRIQVSTLEYMPGRLNVLLDGQGRILAVSCF